jgi:alpha-ketoglutarate-dependent dioxygenase FTO
MQAKIKAGGSGAVAGSAPSGKKRKRRRGQQQQRSGEGAPSGRLVGAAAVVKSERPGGEPSAPGLRPGAPARPYRPPAGLPPVDSAILEPGMRHFDECLSQCYRGFVHQPAALAELEPRMIAALESLKAQHYFHYDVVFGGGIRLGRTFVRRILVGVPGITYKYLGLRIFAHPYVDPSASTRPSSHPVPLSLRKPN